VAEKLKSIETQILFWIIILTVLPLSIVVIQGYHCSKQAIIETNNNRLLSILNWKTSSIASKLKELENELNLLSIVSISSLDEHDEIATCHEFGCTCNPLTHIQETKKMYNLISAYNIKGEKIVDSKPDTFAMSNKILSPKILQTLTNNKGIVYFPNPQNPFSITAGIPQLNKATNTVTGFLTAEVNLKQIFRNALLETPNFGTSGKIFLISLKGKVLSLDKKTGKLTVTDSPENLLTSIKTKKQKNIFQLKLENKTNILTFDLIKKIGFYAVVSIEKKESLYWITVLLKRSLLTVFVTLIFVLTIATMISKKISTPLKQLENVSSEIINGNVNARIPKMDTKEAVAVSNGFNAMMDKLLIQNKELVQSSSLAAIGELSSSIVHEMRNPLSSVKLNLDAIKEKLKGEATYEELAEIASIQTNRLEQMLTELLNYGKPLKFTMRELNPIQLVKDSMDLVSAETTKLQQNIAIIANISETTKIKGDKEHLTRAITNLIKNASEAGGQKGSIKISITQSTHKLKISVEDQGKGFSEAVKDMIFKPFFTTKENGTGLGLANVKKIIETHGGIISAKNSIKGGAIFEIELPLITKGKDND